MRGAGAATIRWVGCVALRSLTPDQSAAKVRVCLGDHRRVTRALARRHTQARRLWENPSPVNADALTPSPVGRGDQSPERERRVAVAPNRARGDESSAESACASSIVRHRLDQTCFVLTRSRRPLAGARGSEWIPLTRQRWRVATLSRGERGVGAYVALQLGSVMLIGLSRRSSSSAGNTLSSSATSRTVLPSLNACFARADALS